MKRKEDNGLKASRMIISILVALSMVALFTGCGVKYILKVSDAEVIAKEDSNNESIALEEVSSIKNALENLEKELIGTNEKDKILKHLNEFKENLTVESEIIYFGTESGEFYTIPEIQLPDDYDHRTRVWYENAKEKGEYISDPYIDISNNNKITSISKAIYKNGELIGVAGIDIIIK